MISKNLYLNIVVSVLIITLTSAIGSFFAFKQDNFIFTLCFALLLLVELIVLIRYLNITNRRLSYFVSAIRNEDTSVKFPNDINHSPTKDLYNSLSIVNDIIRDAKIESEYNENLFKTLIEHSYTGFITIDSAGNFEVMNNAARKYLGVQHTSNLKRLKQNDPSLHQLIISLPPGKTKIHRIEREGERFELSVSTSDITFYDNKFKIVSMQDISKELDKQELDSWHKLFKVITHEIMNSIAPITSLSNTLLKLYDKDGKALQPSEISETLINNTIVGLKSIDEISNGLKNFVENYRQLNKVPKPKIQDVNIENWLRNLKIIIQELIKEKSIELSIKINSACKTISCDERLLNQVLLNLVNNSIDAMIDVKKGKLSIYIDLAVNGKTLISVKDNGKGVSPDEIDKLFIPFFTTKGSGNGIGLSLSKQIISMHGGTINVSSNINKGFEVLILI